MIKKVLDVKNESFVKTSSLAGEFLYGGRATKCFIVNLLIKTGTNPDRHCYIAIDPDLSKPKGMPGLKLHSALASCSFTTKYINKAKA